LFGVDFGDAHRGEGGAGGGAGGTGGTGGTPGHGWTKLELLNGSDGVPHSTTDFVTAVWCQALDHCVVATEGDDFEAGNLYSANHQQVTAILIDGSSVGSDVAFIGLAPSSLGLFARINRTDPLVIVDSELAVAVIDPGNLGAWEGTFAPQLWFQSTQQGSQLALRDAILSSPSAPGSGAVWSPLWMPPTAPYNFFDLLIADQMLCTVGPTVARGPAGWASGDLQYAIFPVGTGFEDDYPGACVSIDGGATYRYAPLPSDEVRYGGPHGARCNDPEHCWLIGDGGVSQPAYIYFLSGSLSAGLTWTRAMIPDGPERMLNDIVFAPDGLHGWVVGSEAPNQGLLMKSDDGGKTWSDNLVADMVEFREVELLTVFALDEHNIWVGGDKGFLMSNGQGGLDLTGP
jgi:hypothetical protein